MRRPNHADPTYVLGRLGACLCLSGSLALPRGRWQIILTIGDDYDWTVIPLGKVERNAKT